MVLLLDRIVIVKKGLTGEASVKYNNLSINKIIIDLNSPVNSIDIPRYDKSPIISGRLVEDLKEQILDFFQESLGDAPDGIYEFVEEREFTANKLS